MEPEEVFKKELAKFSNPDIRKFTIEVLYELPDYFWTVPASSSGKYHPASSLGEGGLIRHTKSALKIAEDLFPFITLGEFTDDEKDVIRAAIMLHDGVKQEYVGKGTVHEHPVLCADLILGMDTDLDRKIVKKIAKAVAAHMSSWNTSSYSSVILPTVNSRIQLFVALCDFLSSRKIFNIEVD